VLEVLEALFVAVEAVLMDSGYDRKALD